MSIPSLCLAAHQKAISSWFRQSPQGLGTGFTQDPLQSQGSLSLSTDGKFLFAVNAGSGDITASVGSDGALTLLTPIAASTKLGRSPIDPASTADGAFIYIIDSAVGGITGCAVKGASLKPIFKNTGLPLSSQGIVAR